MLFRSANMATKLTVSIAANKAAPRKEWPEEWLKECLKKCLGRCISCVLQVLLLLKLGRIQSSVMRPSGDWLFATGRRSMTKRTASGVVLGVKLLPVAGPALVVTGPPLEVVGPVLFVVFAREPALDCGLVHELPRK